MLRIVERAGARPATFSSTVLFGLLLSISVMVFLYKYASGDAFDGFAKNV